MRVRYIMSRYKGSVSENRAESCKEGRAEERKVEKVEKGAMAIWPRTRRRWRRPRRWRRRKEGLPVLSLGGMGPQTGSLVNPEPKPGKILISLYAGNQNLTSLLVW